MRDSARSGAHGARLGVRWIGLLLALGVASVGCGKPAPTCVWVPDPTAAVKVCRTLVGETPVSRHDLEVWCRSISGRMQEGECAAAERQARCRTRPDDSGQGISSYFGLSATRRTRNGPDGSPLEIESELESMGRKCRDKGGIWELD